MTSAAAKGEQDLGRLSTLLVMLALQTAAVFARPALIEEYAATHWIDLLFLGLIVAGLRAVSRSGPLALLALVLGLGASGLGTWARVNDQVGLPLALGLGLGAAYAALIAGVLLRGILTVRRVDGHVLAGATCVYLLLGFVFTLLYAMSDVLTPGIRLFDGIEETGPLVVVYADYLADFQYFSFVTLTTLGYGDVTPLTPGMRGLAVFQAILGQLFLAMLVARLVGLQIASAAASED